MRISPITTNFVATRFQKQKNNEKQQSLYSQNYNISFGWCYPHIYASNDLNKKFNNAISKVLQSELAVRNDIFQKNLAKKTKYSKLDNAAAKAVQLFSQYCNMQYAVAEMIPTYALSTNKSLAEMIKQMEVFQDPVKTLIAIGNVTNLKARAGVDKNTGKEYTQTQTEKAKAGTQLYLTTFLLKQLKEQLGNVDNQQTKNQIEKLFVMVNNSLDGIYGKDTVKRILELSDIGDNPTLEQKQASVRLIEEFDNKAKELTFTEEFEKELQDLIDSENIRLGKTIENTGVGLQSSVEIKLAYHTHAHQHEGHVHDHHHHHHHHHGEMTEEEHRRFHEQEKEQLKAKQ